MRKGVLLTVILFMVSSALGQTGGWNLDKAHSSIRFTIAHMVVSEVNGRFGDFGIEFSSSRDDFADGSVNIAIKTGSINTDNAGRDNDLKSENFFDVQRFPEIRFTGDSFEKGEGSKYKITGDLTIKDVTKRVSFDTEYRGSVKTQRGMVIAWKASTVINRFDYGLKWDRMVEAGGLVAGETVTVNISLELRKQL